MKSSNWSLKSVGGNFVYHQLMLSSTTLTWDLCAHRNGMLHEVTVTTGWESGVHGQMERMHILNLISPTSIHFMAYWMQLNCRSFCILDVTVVCLNIVLHKSIGTCLSCIIVIIKFLAFHLCKVKWNVDERHWNII